MNLPKLARWAVEMPVMLSVLPICDGVRPFAKLRFGNAKGAQIRVRNLGVVSIPDKVTAMVFANIWVRHIYPIPSPNDVILDLGANIGLFSLFALRKGAKFCYCVEPCPDSVDRLRKHLSELELSHRANVIASAVGEKAGMAFIRSVTDVSNTIRSDVQTGTVPVPVLDASELFTSLDPVPTYLKLDIESNEIPVLRRLLSNPDFSSVRTVAVEVKGDYETVTTMLREAGFRVGLRTYPEQIITGFRNSVFETALHH